MAIDKDKLAELREKLTSGVITPDQFQDGVDKLVTAQNQELLQDKSVQEMLDREVENRVRVAEMKGISAKWAETNVAEDKRKEFTETIDAMFEGFKKPKDAAERRLSTTLFFSDKELVAHIEGIAKEKEMLAPKKQDGKNDTPTPGGDEPPQLTPTDMRLQAIQGEPDPNPGVRLKREDGSDFQYHEFEKKAIEKLYDPYAGPLDDSEQRAVIEAQHRFERQMGNLTPQEYSVTEGSRTGGLTL